MAKYDISLIGSELVLERVVTLGDFAESTISFESPTIELVLDKIKFYERGIYKTALRFEDINEIDGVAPTDIEDAKDKTLTVIGSLGGSSSKNLQQVTDLGNITTNIIETPEVKDISDVDKLMVISKDKLTIGNVGNTYNGVYTKYASIYDTSYTYSVEAGSGDSIDFYNAIDNLNNYELFLDKGVYFTSVDYNDGVSGGFKSRIGLSDEGVYLSSQKTDNVGTQTGEGGSLKLFKEADMIFQNTNGNINIDVPTSNNVVLGLVNKLAVIGNKAPSSSGDFGVIGEIRIPNDGYLYICVATNTWQRVAIAAW